MKAFKYLFLVILSMFLTGCTSWGGTTLPEIYTLNLYENETELYQTIEVSAIDKFELPMYSTNDTKVYVGWEDDSSTYVGEIELTSDLDLYLVEENVEDVFVILELVNGLVIESYSGSSTHLKIPMYINDQQVRFIGNKAFEYSDLVEVMIPESVTSISAGAFWHSNNLEAISFYGEIESISKDLFTSDKFIEVMDTFSDECTVINTEDGITYYSDTCPIVSSEKTGEVVINDVEYYSVYVEKQDVYFYDSYTHQFAEYAFANLPSLISFEMPYGWTEFENSFYNTPLLTDVTFPKSNSYKVIDHVVYSSDELSLIYYPSGLDEKSFIIPDRVEIIENYAFGNQMYLESLTLPENLETLGLLAFIEMSNFKSINIDTNENGYYTVDGVLYFEYDEDAPYDIALLKYPENKFGSSFTVPLGVNYISSFAFAYNTLLENIDLPESLISIGSYAFEYTENIDEIIIPAATTTISSRAFFFGSIYILIMERSIIDGDVTWVANLPNTYSEDYMIYVPDDSVDAYRIMFNRMSIMPSYLIDKVRPISEYSTD